MTTPTWQVHAYDKLVTTPAVVGWLRWLPWLAYALVMSQGLMFLINLARGNVNLGTPIDLLIHLGLAACLLLPFDASPLHPAGLPAGKRAGDIPWDPRLARPGLLRLLTRQRVGLAAMLILSVATLGVYPAIWLARRHADVSALGEQPAAPAWQAALPLGLGLVRVALTAICLLLLGTSRASSAVAPIAACLMWWLEAGALAYVSMKWARAIAPHAAPASTWLAVLAPTYALERQLDRLRVRPDATGQLGVVPHAARFQPIGLVAVGSLMLSGLLAWAAFGAARTEVDERRALDKVLARRHEARPASEAAAVVLAERLLDTDPGGDGTLAAAHRLVADMPAEPALVARASLVNARVRLYGGLTGPHTPGQLELGAAGLSVQAALLADDKNVRCWVLKGWIAHLQDLPADVAASIKRARAIAPLDPKLQLLERHLAAEASGKLQPIGGLL